MNRVEKKWKKKKKISASTLYCCIQHTAHTHNLSTSIQLKNTRIPNQRYTVQLTLMLLLLHTNKTRTCSLGERTNHNGTHFHRFLCRRGSNMSVLSSMWCCALLCHAIRCCNVLLLPCSHRCIIFKATVFHLVPPVCILISAWIWKSISIRSIAMVSPKMCTRLNEWIVTWCHPFGMGSNWKFHCCKVFCPLHHHQESQFYTIPASKYTTPNCWTVK